MASILSFLRKDLRYLRWPWLAWLGLLIAKIALGVWCIHAPGFSSSDNTDAMRLDVVLTSLGALTCYLLVLRLVQADAPLRPRAFWHTRPISGGGLLAAKALVAFLLFGLTPGLVSLPWWLANGLGGTDLALAALELLLTHVAIILPAFLLASVVDSFGRAILWSVVQFGAIIGLALFAGPSNDSLSLLEPGLALSRELLAAGIATVGLASLIIWQFRRRRQVAVIVGLALLHVVVAVTWKYSPYNFIPRPAGWTELNAERYKDVALQPNATALYEHPQYRGPEPEPTIVRLTWPVTGLPPDFNGASYHTVLSYDDGQGEAIESKDVHGYAMSNFNPQIELLIKKFGLPPRKTPDGEPRPPFIVILHLLSRDQADHLKRHPPTATTSLHLNLSRSKISQAHPLAPGIAFTDRQGSVRIVSLDTDKSSVQVAVSSTEPLSFLQLYFAVRRSDYQNPPSGYSPVVSHAEDYIFDSTTMKLRGLTEWRESQLVINGVRITRSHVGCDRPHAFRDGKWVPSDIDPAVWRAGLRVVRIAYHEEARLVLTGRSDPLVISGSPAAPSPKP